MATQNDLFEDMAIAIESWTNAATTAMTVRDANLEWVDAEEPYRNIQRAFEQTGIDPAFARIVLAECLRGLAVSFLTALDGGTALAEKGRVYVVDEKGKKLGEGLHNAFVSYLIKSGRLT